MHFATHPFDVKTLTGSLEFKNGIEQSKEYIKQYINRIPKNSNILEIGSSWGYFLYLLNKKKLTFPNAQKVNDLGFFIGLHTKKITDEVVEYITKNLLKISEL